MKLFIKPGCPWCVDVERWLQENRYDYERVDVHSEPEGLDEMRRISGQTLAPTMQMPDGSVLADFGLPELKSFLGRSD